MAKLQIFIDKTPIYSKTNITLRAGFFADDYKLIDVTDKCKFTINFGDDNISQIENNKFFTNKPGDAGISAIYTADTKFEDTYKYVTYSYVATTSFVIINEDSLPNKDDIYACIKREEPEDVYTQDANPESFTYLDNQAVADIFATLYKNLQQEADQIYPELSTDYQDWISMLFDNIYINPEQGQIRQVLKLLRNLQILTSMNPFDIAKAIASYIYFRTGNAIYVYIQEDKINFDRAWILGTNKSILGVNTYLVDSTINTNLIIHIFDTQNQLSQLFRIELEHFIDKISRAVFEHVITYDRKPQEFNLIYDIGQTYKGDRRNIYSYCMKYDKNAFYEVVGLVNPINEAYIKDMRITPANNTEINQPTKFTIIGIFMNGHTADITLSCQIMKSNNNLKIIADVLIPQSSGECKLSITYGAITRVITYMAKVV